MIEYIGKNKAKLTVSTGGRQNRKRYSRTVTYTTKKELERLHQNFVNEVRHKSLGVEATTIRGYETSANRIYSVFKGINAVELTSYMVQSFVTDMSEKYAPKTVRNTISLLSSAYDNAIRLGQIEKNPCKLVTLPKKEQKKIDIFDTEQIRVFLNVLRDERLDYKVAYELALLCGLRRSEILGLKEEDINITFKTVSINKSRHRVNGKDIVQKTKTETSRRNIAIPDFVVEDIKALIEKNNAVPYEHTDFLVQDGFGKPMTPSALTQHIYRIEDKACLPSVSVHDLRHTFASMLNNAHVDIAMISRELGHSSINTTQKTYLHIIRELENKDIDLIMKSISSLLD